jgi:hypothetical protein
LHGNHGRGMDHIERVEERSGDEQGCNRFHKSSLL